MFQSLSGITRRQVPLRCELIYGVFFSAAFLMESVLKKFCQQVMVAVLSSRFIQGDDQVVLKHLFQHAPAVSRLANRINDFAIEAVEY